MPKASWGFLFALLNFLVAAILGLILRFAFVREIPWLDFRNILQGHANLAMLGWLFLSLFLLLGTYFITDFWKNRKFRLLFWLNGLSILLMATAHMVFPLTKFPVVFSLLFVLLSYVFIVSFIRALRKEDSSSIFARKFVYTAFGLFVLSTLGLLCTTGIQLFGLKHGILFYMSVQFFLHFNFNGFFIFSALALLFKFFEVREIRVNPKLVNTFFWILFFSSILTYALALTWSSPHWALFLINSLGVLLQLASLYWFYKIIKSKLSVFHLSVTKEIRWLFGLAIVSFCLKILVQSAVVVPYIAQVAYTVRNYVIGFIHLIMLGVITAVIIAFSGLKGWLKLSEPLTRLGMLTLFVGFVLSELLLILQGTMFWGAKGLIPYYYELLFMVSFLMPLGILIIVLSRFFNTGNKSISTI